MLPSRTAILWTFLAGSFLLLLLFFIGDHQSRLLMRNTVLLALGTIAIGLPVGIVLAAILVRTDLPARQFPTKLLVCLLFVPLFLQAAAWDAGFGALGWYTFTTGSIAEPLLSSWRAAVWVHGVSAVPWVVLIVGLGMSRVEPELEEQALLEGPALQVFLRITLPRSLPSICVAALWIVVVTASEMTVADLFSVRTYAEELYSGFALGDDAIQATRRVLPGIAAVFLLAVWVTVAVTSIVPEGRAGSSRPPLRFALGRWRWPALFLVTLVLLVIVGVPIGNLMYKAGETKWTYDGQLTSNWSEETLIRIVATTPRNFASEFGWTLAIGGLASTAAIVLAAPLAWIGRRRTRSLVPALPMALCLAIPGPLVGFGVIWLLNWNNPLLIYLYDDTILAPVLAITTRCFPAAVMVLWLAMRSIDGKTLEAAASDGASGWTSFFRIVLPQSTGAIAVAWLVAMAVAVGDLSASSETLPGIMTISLRVFTFLHSGVRQQAAGICLVTAAAFFLLAWLLTWLAPKARIMP